MLIERVAHVFVEEQLQEGLGVVRTNTLPIQRLEFIDISAEA